MAEQRSQQSLIKNGTCPECGSTDIYTTQGKYNNKLVFFDNATIDIFVCGHCGYLAEFIQQGRHLQHVRNKWTPLMKRKNEETNS